MIKADTQHQPLACIPTYTTTGTDTQTHTAEHAVIFSTWEAETARHLV